MSPVPTVEELGAAAAVLWEGRSTQAAFLAIADRKLGFVARDVWQGWRKKLPSWVELADVEQELRIQVLAYVPRWEPGRSMGIWDFVIWNAVHRTQRQIHKWRGAQIHGNEGKNPSRAELSFSRVLKPDAERDRDGGRLDSFLASRLGPSEDATEERLDRSAKFEEVLQRARTIQEALVLHALRTCDGSIRRAAEVIWGDVRARIECDLRDLQDAHRVICRALEAIAGRCCVEAPEGLWDEDEEDADESAA